MKRSIVKRVLVMVGLSAASAAVAQAPDTARADTAGVVHHPELVVRALRAPVPAEALPYAVTVRRPSLGVPTAGLSLGDELRAVPGLQVHSRFNDALGDRIVMRGFGARAQFGVRGVQVLVDGIPATMPDGQTTLNHLELALLDRAEVLRGPAAAAYGNAAGGVLLLSTVPPPGARLRQEVSVAAGEAGLLRLRSTTGGSGGSAGWIASLTRETREGFRLSHSSTERYQLTGRFDAPLAGGYLRAVAHGVSYDADNPGSLTLEQFREDPQQAQEFNVRQRTGEDGRHGQVGLAWERAFDETRLEAAVYGLVRSLENPIPPTIIDLTRGAGGARILLRSAGSDPGAAAWAAGVDAALQADDRQNFENVAGERGPLTLDQAERVANVAVHGQAMVPMLDRLNLFVGARYDRVTFSGDDRFITGGNPDDSGRRAMDAFSPTAGLRLELAPDVGVFANVSTAFETPTTTELVNRPDGSGGFNQALEPQRTLSYEIGGRATVSDLLRLQASAYHAGVSDALIPFEVAASPGRQFFRNAGAAVHRGGEVLAELAMDRVDLLAAYSRTRARFSSYVVNERSFDGNAVPGVRPWTAGVLLTVRPTRALTVSADYQATGGMAVDDANEARAPGYHLLGVRAAAPGLRVGRVEAEPYAGVQNVLDETYVASVVPNAFGGRFFEPGPGRTFYLGIELRLAIERGSP